MLPSRLYAVEPASIININNKILLSILLILSIQLPPAVEHCAVCFEICQDKVSSDPNLKEGIDNLRF